MDANLLKRICKVGPKALDGAARDAALYFSSAGAKIWARGMLDSVNKGLRNKFRFIETWPEEMAETKNN